MLSGRRGGSDPAGPHKEQEAGSGSDLGLPPQSGGWAGGGGRTEQGGGEPVFLGGQWIPEGRAHSPGLLPSEGMGLKALEFFQVPPHPGICALEEVL